MKQLFCAACSAAMTNDEIALCLHLHGGAATRFLCAACMAAELECPPRWLQKKIGLLKKSGCRYFAETYV